jgi:hypothetical protein
MWTYSGNPQASPVDLVHYRLGDTNPSEPMATDEECSQALLDHGGNSWLAAASIAETKAAHFLNRPLSVKRGDRTTTYADPVQGFLLLARTLRMQASTKTTSVYAGGLSKQEHASDAGDADLTQPFARKELLPARPVSVTQVPLPQDRSD